MQTANGSIQRREGIMISFPSHGGRGAVDLEQTYDDVVADSCKSGHNAANRNIITPSVLCASCTGADSKIHYSFSA